MKVLSFPHGEVRFTDCIEAMRGLPDGAFDLCFTDPPYNIDFCSEYTPDKLMYNDSMDDFPTFMEAWLTEAIRVANGVMFTPGGCHMWDYVVFRKPDYQLRVWYKSNAEGYNSHMEPFLAYGKIRNYSALRDVLDFVKADEPYYTHPTYKQYDVWKHIIKKLAPESVIDPFLGSGTTAQACEELGIPYLGFEIVDEYAADIEKRGNLGMKAYECRQAVGKQKALF